MNLINIPCRLPTFTSKWLLSRSIKKSAVTKSNQKLILEQLVEREVIQVKGDEVVPFLQGLITNDVKHLCSSPNNTIYAMFLNKTGRVMYDVILYSTSEPTKILIECDKNIANELQRHLKLYRVRRKIDIVSLNEEFNVWQAFKPTKEAQDITNAISNEELTDITISADPRLKQLGIRILANTDQTFSDLSILFKSETAVSNTGDNSFRLHRYSLGIAEGVIDIPPGKCFPLEANCDILNGVSFHKGCYIGQELTARVHHTGMVRKRHMPVGLTAPLSTDTTTIVQNEEGLNCGVIYGSLADKALGLLRVEKVLKAKELLVNGNLCVTERPQWWPHELYSNVLKEVRKGI